MEFGERMSETLLRAAALFEVAQPWAQHRPAF
jgi:hypothetical protein